MKGRRIITASFRITISPSFDGYPHIAVVISKKQAKTAVARNRARRVCYEGARQALQTPVSLILSPTRPVADLSVTLVRDEISKLRL
ncbi:MAG: ribonuclease P protein component [Candidatus Pacebacteria bacterium]|nr:ribonuclease P protein component [Candidatus Paceibacterota bacterium]